MMKLAFGAGSVPCKPRHIISTEIELARSGTLAGAFPSGSPSRVRCSVFWSASWLWRFFVVDRSRGLGARARNLKSSEMSVFESLRKE